MRLAIVVFTLCCPAAVLAQTIDADRPGLLFAGSVLPAGRAQLELAAFEVARRGNGADHSTLLSFPSVLRLGLGHAIELQVGHALVNRLSTASAGRSDIDVGLGDLSLGVKFARPPSPSLPGLVVVGSLGLPTGQVPFTNDDPLLGLQAQASWVVGPGLSLGGLAGYSRTLSDGGDAAGGILALSLGVPLAASWSAYVETGYFPASQAAPDAGHLGGGITRVVRDRVQLDAFLNRGLSAASVDWTVGGGVSIRF